MRPRRSGGDMSTFQAEPAVKTVPSPAPRKRRETIRPGIPAGTKSRQPAIAARTVPVTTVGLRPRTSAACPAIGRQTMPVRAKAPLTTPTSKSLPPSSSLT